MSNVVNFPLLSLVLFTPLAGAILLLFVNKRHENAIRWIANVFACAGFVVSLPLWFSYNPQDPGWQFVEKVEWIPSIGAQYFLGVDGFSCLLILLTTLMGSISVLSSWTAITQRVKEYYIFLLVLQTGMIGAFVSLDFLLFFLFWEVMLVPMYFLIGIWGSDRRLYSAIKFFLYTLVGSVVMLLGILALYFSYHTATGVYTFDITRFQQANFNTTGLLWWTGLGNAPTFDIVHFHAIASQIPLDLQIWLFWAFFLGFAIKVPMFPFHTWLPDAHVEAPTAGSVILAGVLLKMGTYGFLRFSLPICPDASRTFWVQTTVIVLSIIGIVYGSMVAMVQPDMKKLVAYSSVAHLGFCMLGFFALNTAGLQGGILQSINHGLSTGGLFLLVGIVYERRHTRMIADYGGLSAVMPIYATLFMIILLASIGLPVLNGFIGEFTILVGAFLANWRWAVWACLGIVLGAAYMLWLYQRVFFGEIKHEENRALEDVNVREILTLAPLIVLCLWIGVYPKPFFAMTAKSTEKIVAAVSAPRPAPPAGKVAAGVVPVPAVPAALVPAAEAGK